MAPLKRRTFLLSASAAALAATQDVEAGFDLFAVNKGETPFANMTDQPSHQIRMIIDSRRPPCLH